MTNLIKLNLARNCLKYIIKAYGIKELFIPYYICPVVWLAARQVNCRIKFYQIDENFMPINKFPQNAFILYVNYFGLCDKNCKNLTAKYQNIIIDNSQSFYSKPMGLASFNSLRKFFKVQNGAYLYINKIIDKRFEQDEQKFNPVLFHENIEQFIKNELTLNQATSIKEISPNIKNILKSIDLEKDKSQRLKIYNEYDKTFDKFNRIKLKTSQENIPYCYPLNTEDKNIRKILAEEFILQQLWKDLPQNICPSYNIGQTIALPLNDIEYAKKIITHFQ